MELVVIAHNIRSTHNVGSIFRTCDGFGVKHLYITGYTPYPTMSGDTRLPHLREKLTNQIHKTALGAETEVPCSYTGTTESVIANLKARGYVIVALEQSSRSIQLNDFSDKPKRIALFLGEEVHGIEPGLLEQCDVVLEIPMVGKKESFNVSVAAGIALYELSRPTKH